MICMACASWLITAGLRLSYLLYNGLRVDLWCLKFSCNSLLAISCSSLVIHEGFKNDGSKDGRHMAMEMEITMNKGPYYFTVNMIACDDVLVILFFHVLFILDMIIILE